MKKSADIGYRESRTSDGSADASVYESLFVGIATQGRPVRGASGLERRLGTWLAAFGVDFTGRGTWQ